MKITVGIVTSLFLILFFCGSALALQPEEILVIANSDIAKSVELSQYYCLTRSVPVGNIVLLPLGEKLSETINRDDYEKLLAKPIRSKLKSDDVVGEIRCLVTTYGVPIKVGARAALKGQQNKLDMLRELLEEKKEKNKRLELSGSADAEEKKNAELQLLRLQAKIDYITGRETNASVDSELSMVLFEDYELYRWQSNRLKYKIPYWDRKTLMVCRLDGPSTEIAEGLVDKAMVAERAGLKGLAYIDSGYSKIKKHKALFKHFDESLLDLAYVVKTQTQLDVVQETTSKLFEPGQCPRTALYCGWYSLKNYIDAFDFVDGAVGYHIASYEAMNLRDPNSGRWCASMLKEGITATLGAVAEPYLQAFPEPKAFFNELIDGYCLVEAFYHTKPYNSCPLVFVCFSLYRPFNKMMQASVR